MVRAARILALLALGVLAVAVPSQAETPMTRRIVVFAPSVPAAQRVALAESTGAKVVRELPLIHAVVVESPANRISVDDTRLTSLSEVARIDQDPKINWLQMADAPGVDFALPALKSAFMPLDRSGEVFSWDPL